MESNICVSINQNEYSIPEDAAFIDAAREDLGERKYTVLGAIMNGRVYSLAERIPGSGSIRWVDITHNEGARMVARSFSFLLVRAVRELFEGATVLVEHSLNRALYCQIRWNRRITACDINSVEGRMREIAHGNEPFVPVEMPVEQAKAEFLADGRRDVAELLPQHGVFCGYRCGGLLDVYYGPLVPSTGYLKLFRLKYCLPGLLMMFPNSFSPDRIPPFAEMPKLSAALGESAWFGSLIGVMRIAELNFAIRTGKAREIVRVCEARQEVHIARIAESICRESKRAILVAGPSSSGKTTFSNRLAVHLRACGLTPLLLSLDDYYLNRDACPLEPDGTCDVESIRALDLALFEQQVTALLCGEEIELAKFDFLTGRGVPSGRAVTLGPGQPLIIEGINGLNEELTSFLPANSKYRIYVSALTQLNMDDHNRIATTDVRHIRRIVRDSLFRGHSAEKTIEAWPTVHGAEFKNIFPSQENADVLFNSALVYELAALRSAALPLLSAIKDGHPSRVEADRLAAILSLVEPLACEDEIPPTSILREFIGGNTFYL